MFHGMRLAFVVPMNGETHRGTSGQSLQARNYSPIVCDDDMPALYRDALIALRSEQVPFLVGGAYAMALYTQIDRLTKDLDIFVAERDCQRALDVLAGVGCRTEHTFTHWLAKACRGDAVIDVIYGSGNGVAMVDEAWFTHARDDRIGGIDVKTCPPEELVWSKAFVMERERYDGADVLHVVRGQGPALEWPRLLGRFGDHWRVLFSHLVLYGFIYPTERHRVPQWVMEELTLRLASDGDDDWSRGKTCFGTLVSRQQYLADIDREGFGDGRLVEGVMTSREIAAWTNAIDKEA
jgi:Nucleotidyl transferase of unknown function (DUF2204)